MSWRAFIDGAARVLDLFGTMSPSVDLPQTDDEAFARDRQALYDDWLATVRRERGQHATPPDQLLDALHDPVAPPSGNRIRSRKVNRGT